MKKFLIIILAKVVKATFSNCGSKVTVCGTAFIFAICFAFPIVSLAQDGSLDLNFDSDGMVSTPIGTGDDRGYSIATQSDGKIVLVGYSYNGSNMDFSLVRYNINGSLDNTFDSDGMVTTSVGTGDDIAYSIAIQSDGKIILAGYSYNGSNMDFSLVRYNINGSLDNTFDSDGMVITPVGTGNDIAYSIAIQSDGKIILAGYSYNGSSNDFALVRYNINGSLDNTFDFDGFVITSIGSNNDIIRSLVIQSDGKIVAAGIADISGDKFALVRYNTNGSLDNTFDTDGIVITPVGTPVGCGVRNLAIQSDGKVLAGGYSYNGWNNDFALVRYNTNGSLDSTFDTDGIVTIDINGDSDVARSVSIQINGKIVVAGSSRTSGYNDFALVRFHTNGSLDNTFDTDGIVITPFGSYDDLVFSMAIQSDGKILAAGYSNDGWSNDFALVRYNAVSITNQPTNQSVYVSSNAQFITSASDSLASIQWQTDLGIGFQTLNNAGQYSGTTNDTLLISNTTIMNNNQPFRCIITLGSCTETSNVAFLIVCGAVTIQPANQIVNNSSNAIFTTVSTDLLATFQWQTDLGFGFQTLNNAGQYSGTTNDTLIILNTSLSNNNQTFRCIISSGSCTDTSSTAVLTVQPTSILTLFSQSNLFSIYPNPAKSQINIKTDATLIGFNYTIYNYTGLLILKGRIYNENTVVELGNLPSGLYILKAGENLIRTFEIIKG